MERRALAQYTARAIRMVEKVPPQTAAETRTWLVEPLLSTLGWDLRSAACETDVTVRGVDIEYLLWVGEDGSTPALFVAVEPADGSLRSGREQHVAEAMAATGVDRAIYTNGQRFVLIVRKDSVKRIDFDLQSLPDNADIIGEFTAEKLSGRLVRQTREIAGRRLAVVRDELADTIAEDLAAIAGEPYLEELRADAVAFLDDLVVWFAGGNPPPDYSRDNRATGNQASATPGRSSTDSSGGSEHDGSVGSTKRADSVRTGRDTADRAHIISDTTIENRDSAEGSTTETAERDPHPAADGDELAAAAGDSPSTSGESASDEEADVDVVLPRTDENGEFVVRFFNQRGSIGAIGHSTSAGALAHAASFLFENGLSGIRLPWGPGAEDDAEDELRPEETVVNDRPVLADGTKMEAYHELSNGRYVNTAGDVADRADRIEALTSRAGLRAMLSGDWES